MLERKSSGRSEFRLPTCRLCRLKARKGRLNRGFFGTQEQERRAKKEAERAAQLQQKLEQAMKKEAERKEREQQRERERFEREAAKEELRRQKEEERLRAAEVPKDSLPWLRLCRLGTS